MSKEDFAIISVRLSRELFELIDDLRRMEKDIPSRGVMMRRLRGVRKAKRAAK